MWILVWLACLTIPTFEQWHWASAQHGVDEFAPPWAGPVQIVLALVTILLGFALGWQRGWALLWVAVVLGALVMAVGSWVEGTQGWSWSGGEPLPPPMQFVWFCVLLGVLLGFGAGVAALASTVRRRLQSSRLKSAI